MIKIHVVQAEYGDCFIIESKIGKKSINILIDGGPYQTFEKHLKPTLQNLPSNSKLDLMVLSHIDNDHIIGLIDLLLEIKNERENGAKELVDIQKIWHNSFEDLLQFYDSPKKLIESVIPIQNNEESNQIADSLIMKGFQQGTDLTELAKSLRIPINADFPGLVVIDDKIKSLTLGDIILHILGPTKKNVDRLQKEWKNWIKEKRTTESHFGLVQILDKSIPNLASITFLVEAENRKILFTGDGLGQDIIDVLAKNSMFDSNGRFYVDVLKIPHHGSDRNISAEFLDSIYAKYYVISANGRDDNPSLSTLRWIIESRRSGGASRKIILTNFTSNIKKILEDYDQNKYNYECIILKNKSDFITINLK